MAGAPRRKPFLVGLTGGIASGKSTVSDLFAALGVEVIDADVIAREVVAPGSAALEAIRARFGAEVLESAGALRREALRARIFAQPEERRWLEALLHPLIRGETMRRIEASQAPYVILAVPLLLESGEYDYVDRVLVVDLEPALQLERAMRRDHSDEGNIRRIMAAQLPRERRLAQADDVIHNDDSLLALREKVRALHEFYSEQAHHQAG
jgi:dephospho-CoA kinase